MARYELRNRDLGLILLAFVGASSYLILAASRGATGFALDDAWIHQVYARNLALRGEFAFFPGSPSTGSTSPLWTVALAVGYLLRLDPRLWSLLLGALLMGLSAILTARVANWLYPRALLSDLRIALIVLPIFVILEWHLAWGAVSGMEIPLFVFLSLLLTDRLFVGERSWVLGLIAGLLTCTRLEGVVLAGLVGFARLVIAVRSERKEPSPGVHAIGDMIVYALSYAITLAPSVLFNLYASGTLFPNTFFAKSTEYAVLFEQAPFIVRWAQLFLVPWVGAQLLLLPGFIFVIAALISRRKWLELVPAAWVLILPALYALRLPVAYQHGRYEMPVIPFILLYGVGGTAALFERMRNRILRRTWGTSIAALAVAFWVVGANAFATDVAIIDCEMVQTAQWVARNIPAGTPIAAHDIGALGYFYEHPIIDLAGLVSPEVIPFMRDQARLRDFLISRQVTFAIFFPDWYPALASDPRFTPAHQQVCPAALEAGGTDMRVYRIQ